MFCEVGLCKGGGIKELFDAVEEKKNKDRWIISIDPYGDIIYKKTSDRKFRMGYDDTIYRYTMTRLFSYVEKHSLNYVFYKMTDESFMEHFANGVPIFDYDEKIINTYALIHFDGPHDFESVLAETHFFY